MKQQLEKDIFELIKNFEKETGLSIESISVRKEYVDFKRTKKTEGVELVSII